MNSNKHGTVEQNEEHLVANISIYHARKTEQYAMRYDAMNRATICENNRDLEDFRSQPRDPDLNRGGTDAEAAAARRRTCRRGGRSSSEEGKRWIRRRGARARWTRVRAAAPVRRTGAAAPGPARTTRRRTVEDGGGAGGKTRRRGAVGAAGRGATGRWAGRARLGLSGPRAVGGGCGLGEGGGGRVRRQADVLSGARRRKRLGFGRKFRRGRCLYRHRELGESK